MTTTDRLLTEREFHDRQARDRAVTFQTHPEALQFADDAYLDHETWIRPALAELGNLDGKQILDYGCGHAMAAVVMARRGAKVTAFDLSHGYVQEAQQRALVNSVNIRFAQADAEHLPFADQSFDAIWGNAILHHLDLSQACAEIRRVLRPGGVAVFCEPWGENPLLRLARARLPYPGKEHTPEEQPLRSEDLAILRKFFPNLEVRGYQLLSMARRILPGGGWARSLDWCDAMILQRIPRLQNYCRYVVLTLRS